jgi:glyoxylase-like metal-dependent hydrolase (beta-lactamase superfamily II)
VRAIDLHHVGRERVICCWEHEGVLIDPGPESCLDTLLAALDGERPRAVLLTHIHFDHAGAAGALVERWPDLEVWVHERGARHLVDPERLVASARRLYGEDFDRLWGRVVPVPRESLRVLEGGERDVLGAYDVVYAPGHASHHVLYLHRPTGTALTGDVAGVRVPPSPLVVAPTPPPDIDLEAWERSLQALEAWQPTCLGITHAGGVDDPEAQIAGVRDWLATWAPRARDLDSDAFVAEVRAAIAEQTDPGTAKAYDQAAPPDQLWQGLRRYWTKRAGG